MSAYQSIREACDRLNVGPGLAAWPSWSPPFVIELAERDYPNRRIAASRDPLAILAAANLWHMAARTPDAGRGSK